MGLDYQAPYFSALGDMRTSAITSRNYAISFEKHPKATNAVSIGNFDDNTSFIRKEVLVKPTAIKFVNKSVDYVKYYTNQPFDPMKSKI